jgi:hypothetical protein
LVPVTTPTNADPAVVGGEVGVATVVLGRRLHSPVLLGQLVVAVDLDPHG